MEERTTSDTPLLGRSGAMKSRTARYIAYVSAVAACVVIALVIHATQRNQDSLAQGAVKYYYVPKAAMKNNKLPLHLMVFC